MDLNLCDKVALVTGGSRGLGRAICIQLAAEGVVVAVHYRSDPEKAKELAVEIETKYQGKAMLIQGDITLEKDVRRIFAETREKFGGLDILVNNAGICPISPVKDTSLAGWEKIIQTNLTGTFLTCREMVNLLLSQERPGKIVNIASSAAFIGSKNGKSHYAASKGGVVSFTVSLAKEVASFGINVNAVAPGMLYTEMTAATLDQNMAAYQKEIPLGRIAELDEVARTVCFLASEAAASISGATIDVSGGIVGR